MKPLRSALAPSPAMVAAFRLALFLAIALAGVASVQRI
jgi:hypothetical protein